MPHQEPARYDSTANERRLTTKDRSCDPVPAVVLDKATLTLEHIEEAGRIFDEIDGCESFETSREMIANDSFSFYAAAATEVEPGNAVAPEGYTLVQSVPFGDDSNMCELDGLAPTTIIEHRTHNVTASIAKRVVSSQYAILRLRVVGGSGGRGDVFRKDDLAAGVSSFIVSFGYDAP